MKSRRFKFVIHSKGRWGQFYELSIRAKTFKSSLAGLRRFERWVVESHKMKRVGIYITLNEDFDPDHIVPHPDEWGHIEVSQEFFCPDCEEYHRINFCDPEVLKCIDCGRIFRACFMKHCDNCDHRVICLTIE